MVNQVTVVAILMIVQGAFEILLGLVLVVVALVIPPFFEEAVRQQQQFQGGPNPRPDMPEGVLHFLAFVYLAMGVAGILPGTIRIIAGIRNLSYRGRTFGIVSHFLGLASIGTLYCSLTSIGLTIYGLIVYFNSEVERAFALGEQGLSAGEIKARYYRDPDRFREADGGWSREEDWRERPENDAEPGAPRDQPPADDYRFKA